jgi:hypothetical protein
MSTCTSHNLDQRNTGLQRARRRLTTLSSPVAKSNCHGTMVWDRLPLPRLTNISPHPAQPVPRPKCRANVPRSSQLVARGTLSRAIADSAAPIARSNKMTSCCSSTPSPSDLTLGCLRGAGEYTYKWTRGLIPSNLFAAHSLCTSVIRPPYRTSLPTPPTLPIADQRPTKHATHQPAPSPSHRSVPSSPTSNK